MFFFCWFNLTHVQSNAQHTLVVKHNNLVPSIKGTVCFILRLLFQATFPLNMDGTKHTRHSEPPSTADLLIKFLNRMIRNKISSIRRMDPRKLNLKMVFVYGSNQEANFENVSIFLSNSTFDLIAFIVKRFFLNKILHSFKQKRKRYDVIEVTVYGRFQWIPMHTLIWCTG